MRNYELEVPISINNDALEKNDDRCITCGECKKVCTNDVTVAKMYEYNKDIEPICINCGQCANICPTESIKEKMDYVKVVSLLKNKNNKKIIFNIAPAVRVALCEDLDIELGTNLEKQIVTALKQIGADYVFDITFSADLTIMEEATELVNRIKNNTLLPQFTSCCPAWVKFCEIFYQEYINNLSSAKSPIAMQGSLIKTYFKEKINVDEKELVNITISPCTAKKSEINRLELNVTEKDTDYILTTRELALLLKEFNVEMKNIKETEFDKPLGLGSSAGVIFGSTGGVAEAALRTAYFLLTNKNLEKEELEFKKVRGMNDVKEATVNINGIDINVCVVNGMKNVHKIIEQVKNKEKNYHFIEVMNCIGGCIAGGGQPKVTKLETINTKLKRIDALYEEDEKSKLRLCHENECIKEIYETYLDHPNSEIAEKLLHTKYTDKSYLLKGESK